jgi:hypothetical protein
MIIMLRSVQNMAMRLTEMEILSQSMQQEITSYKGMFERNNLTLTAMAEHMGDQIFALIGKIDEHGNFGENIDFLDTFD